MKTNAISDMRCALGAMVVGLAAAPLLAPADATVKASEEYPDFYAGDTTKGIDFVQSIQVLAPAYCSNVKGDVTVVFKAPGMTQAKAFCWRQPTPERPGEWGHDAQLADVALGADATGSFVFPADTFPNGPTTIRIQAKDDKNKQDKDQVKLWLYGLVDDHSSAVFAWFYAGLSSQNAVDFLVRAMGRKGPELLADQPGAPAWLRCPGVAPAPGEDRMDWFRDASFPFCGVPDKILTDNDVILKSEKTLFKAAFEFDATGIVLAHNHPGGSTLTSMQDRELTRRVQQIGESLELTLIDHLIVTANNGTSSFRTAGWL